MRDLIILLVMGGFTALCVAYVRWCDRIIGPDPAPTESPAASDTPTPADTAEVRS